MTQDIHSKDFVCGLIEVLSQGIRINCLEEAETLLTAVRILRPKLQQLDTYDAWIAIRRGQWMEAMGILRGLDFGKEGGVMGQALLAFCQFAMGDKDWQISANEVMESSCPEAAGLIRLMLGKEEPEEEESAAGADADAPPADTSHYAYTHMRA